MTQTQVYKYRTNTYKNRSEFGISRVAYFGLPAVIPLKATTPTIKFS